MYRIALEKLLKWKEGFIKVLLSQYGEGIIGDK